MNIDPVSGEIESVSGGDKVTAPNPSPDGSYFLYAKNINGYWSVIRYDRATEKEVVIAGGPPASTANPEAKND